MRRRLHKGNPRRSRETAAPLEETMTGDEAYYLTAIVAVILLGLSKGGFSGLSSLSMPLMSLTLSPVRAAAILLPILVVQDWVGIWAFRKDWDGRNLAILIPSSIIGVALGWLLAAQVPESWVRLAVGLISVGFVLFMVARARFGASEAAKATVAPGMFWGAAAGFTSFVSHSGSPPFQVYVMPQRLEPRIFAGTATMFFAAVNLLKLPPYLALGQFSNENLRASALLFPLAIVSTLAGVWLVRRVDAERFYAFVYVLTFLIGLRLTWQGLAEILA
jgi:uncharacterized membrane protein YfcA